MEKLKSYLTEYTDARALGLLRIVIGSWFFIDLVSILIIGRVKLAYIDAQVNFPFYGFEWIQPLPAAGMYILMGLLIIASVGITLGKFYRLSLISFIIGFGYIFMLDIPYTLNKFYLLLILAFVLLFVPGDRTLSFRNKKHPEQAMSKVPRWTIFIFQFFFGFIYVLSGLSKINPDWLFHAQPLRTFFGNRSYFQVLDDQVFNVLVFAFSYGGMIFDLSIIWLLRSKKTRLFGNLWQASFHALNFFILGIGSLSIFAALMTWLLFPTKWLSKRVARLKLTEGAETTYRLPAYASGIFVIFLAVQLIVPFRHVIIPNNVNWTEKGHRFSWRLMTRTKSGSSSMFYVTDLKSGEVWPVYPMTYLTSRQYRKMSAETDLIIHFGHFLEKEWQSKGYDSVMVNAEVRTRLNGRPAGFLIDPELDLTKVSRSFLDDQHSLPPPERTE